MTCPSCGKPVPDDSIWKVQNKFCCSQECAEKRNARAVFNYESQWFV